jgi:hypothetical protein
MDVLWEEALTPLSCAEAGPAACLVEEGLQLMDCVLGEDGGQTDLRAIDVGF